jgi:sortase (surface protein transpeptidase)
MKQHANINLAKLSLLLGAILLCLAIVTYIRQSNADHAANVIASHDVALANQGKPSPAPATVRPSPKTVANYTVPASHPRYLSIPSLGIKTQVLAVGLTSAHAIGTPSNVYDTAWYDATTLPGQPGATLIDGHVSSWTTHGVFYNLKSLVPGDSINIQTGDGNTYTYLVVKTQIYAAADVDVNSLLKPVDPTKSGLNLITCTGDVIKGTSSFDKRVVVYASLSS